MYLGFNELIITFERVKKNGIVSHVQCGDALFDIDFGKKYAHGDLTKYIAKCFLAGGVKLSLEEAIQVKNEYFKKISC